MEEKKPNKLGLGIVIGVLIALVIGLSGFIIYDKVLENDNKQSEVNNNEQTDNEKSEEKENNSLNDDSEEETSDDSLNKNENTLTDFDISNFDETK